MFPCTKLAIRVLQRTCRPSGGVRFAHVSEVPPRLMRPELGRLSNTTTRPYSGHSKADLAVEDITELYATARDEFEIALEETQNATIYAQDDRDAARAELEKVKAAYQKIVEGEDRELAQQVSKRVGRHIQELEQNVKNMEQMATEHD